MKNVLKITVFAIMTVFMVNCSSNDDESLGGNIPSNGWRIGSTNYTTYLSMRNIAGANTLGAFDKIPGDGTNTVAVIFNNTAGISAGTYKIVTTGNQSDLLADEIMIGTNINYNNSTGHYEKEFVPVIGQNVSATVTITGGKVKVVIPEINIVSLPISASSTTNTFAGTIIEQ
ncbi:hypothetical protein [Polaribacter gangjinensis]|uniref:Uncharacterized protein n=1 Tax=Polaribacter gangjinensis TaxID=574710 RepID=A0A2S7WBI5_9FLAO|nr:hypothetical protein [Polaribacter gangjinensis]PQJ74592.1 hypothetical protein BTO13_04660 [Polaribacter gangjinensis]